MDPIQTQGRFIAEYIQDPSGAKQFVHVQFAKRLEHNLALEVGGEITHRRRTLGVSAIGSEHDRMIALLRDLLGSDELENLMAVGATMSDDEADCPGACATVIRNRLPFPNGRG